MVAWHVRVIASLETVAWHVQVPRSKWWRGTFEWPRSPTNATAVSWTRSRPRSPDTHGAREERRSRDGAARGRGAAVASLEQHTDESHRRPPVALARSPDTTDDESHRRRLAPCRARPPDATDKPTNRRRCAQRTDDDGGPMLLPSRPRRTSRGCATRRACGTTGCSSSTTATGATTSARSRRRASSATAAAASSATARRAASAWTRYVIRSRRDDNRVTSHQELVPS